MDDIPLQFGPDDRMLGIWTPAQGDPAPVACLLFNAGVIHRIGPHRINVKAARALAAVGVPSLRFDLSGQGDTPGATGSADFRTQALLDLQAAMDRLEASEGIRRFLVFGICSGAVHAYSLAFADPRVVGVLLFDSFVYPTPKTQVVRRWKRFRRMSWTTLLRNVVSRITGDRRPPRPAKQQLESGGMVSEDGFHTPSRPEFAASLDALIRRGVSVYIVYSGSLMEEHNYHAQLRDAFPGAAFHAHIRYDFMPDVDHTFTSLDAQRRFLPQLVDWARAAASAQGAAR